MKRFIACCLALLALFGLLSLAACKPADDPAGVSTTEAPASSTPEDTSLDSLETESTAELPSETGAPEDTEAETETGETTEPGSETATATETGTLTTTATGQSQTGAATVPTTAAASKFPINGTKAEIVKYYNTVANNTKSQKNFSARKDEKLDCAISEGFLTVVDGLLDDLLRKDNKNITETFRNGKGTQEVGRTTPQFLPVEGQTYMSKLDPAWVKSATCKAKGNGCEIVIVLNDESFLAKSEDAVRHHSCMDTLDIDWNDVPFNVEDTTMGTVSNATITAQVNANGEVLDELHIYEPVEVRGRIQVVIWAKLVVSGYWKQDIWFTYP